MFENVHLGDTTNFVRSAKFFVSAVSTAFLAEVATLYLLGIGNVAEPYYWLFILLTWIPFVLFSFLLQACYPAILPRCSASLLLPDWCWGRCIDAGGGLDTTPLSGVAWDKLTSPLSCICATASSTKALCMRSSQQVFRRRTATLSRRSIRSHMFAPSVGLQEMPPTRDRTGAVITVLAEAPHWRRGGFLGSYCFSSLCIKRAKSGLRRFVRIRAMAFSAPFGARSRAYFSTRATNARTAAVSWSLRGGRDPLAGGGRGMSSLAKRLCCWISLRRPTMR